MPKPEMFEYVEERRLFYIALTRASRGVFLLTNSRKPSRSEIAGTNLRFETVDGGPLHQCPTWGRDKSSQKSYVKPEHTMRLRSVPVRAKTTPGRLLPLSGLPLTDV